MNETEPHQLIDFLSAEMDNKKGDASPAKLLEPSLPETSTHGDHTHIHTADHTHAPETLMNQRLLLRLILMYLINH